MPRDLFRSYSSAATWVYDHVKVFTRLTPYQGCLTSLYAATSPEIKEKEIRGRFFQPIAKLGEAKGFAMDGQRQKDLCKLSESLLEERGFKIPKI